MPSILRSPLVWVSIAIAASGGLLAAIAATPYPGVTVDSGEYLSVAEALLEGRGFTMPYVSYDEAFRVLNPGERIPMLQFPPIYPMVLAGAQWATGLDALAATRLLGAATYVLMIGLAQFIVWRWTRARGAAIVTGLLLLVPAVLTIHAVAWSEATMILAMLAALHLTVAYLRSHDLRLLAFAGLCGAVASLIRLAGFAVVIAIGVAVALDRGVALRKRLKVAVGATALSSLPVALWFVRNTSVSGMASEKELGWHFPSLTDWMLGAQTLGTWFLPGKAMPVAVGTLLAIAVVVLLPRAVAGLRAHGASSLALACLLFAICSTGFVLAARMFLDQNVPLDPRMLAPTHVLLIVGFGALLGSGILRGRSRTVVYLVGAFVVLSVARGVWFAQRFSETTLAGYTSDDWRDSGTMAFVGSLPSSTLILTNAPDAVWLWEDREPLFLPTQSDLYSGDANSRYRDQLGELLSATACRDAYVAFFDQPTRRPRRYIDPEVVEVLGLHAFKRFPDGEVYQVTEPRSGC